MAAAHPPSADALLKDCLTLPVEERGRIAAVLIESMGEPEDSSATAQELEQLWISESLRRFEEMQLGLVSPIDARQAVQAIRAEFGL